MRPLPPTAPGIFLEYQQRRGLGQRLVLTVQITLQLQIRQPQLPQLVRFLSLTRSPGDGAEVAAPLRQDMGKESTLPAPGVQRLFVQTVAFVQRQQALCRRPFPRVSRLCRRILLIAHGGLDPASQGCLVHAQVVRDRKNRLIG